MIWTNLTRTVAPTLPVVTVADAKAQLRILHDDDDALIERLIEVATATIEGPTGIGRVMRPQTWRMTLNGFPCREITIPLTPVTGIVSITFRSTATGSPLTINSALYVADLDQRPAVIRPVDSWPSADLTTPGSVKVTFTAGSDDMPTDLIHAVLMMVAHLYENPEAVTDRVVREVPLGVQSILNRYRVA